MNMSLLGRIPGLLGQSNDQQEDPTENKYVMYLLWIDDRDETFNKMIAIKTYQYNLRNQQKKIENSRLSIYAKSFFPSTLKVQKTIPFT